MIPQAIVFRQPEPIVYARLYHTVALLLPDATVWLAGSNPSRGTYETHMEIYQPAYLFTRDGNNNLVAATAAIHRQFTRHIGWALQFAVSSPDAASISQVGPDPAGLFHAWVRHGSTSGGHVISRLDRDADGDGATQSNIAPPGYYMLFLINSKGVPSVAKFLLLDSSGKPAAEPDAVVPGSGSREVERR